MTVEKVLNILKMNNLELHKSSKVTDKGTMLFVTKPDAKAEKKIESLFKNKFSNVTTRWFNSPSGSGPVGYMGVFVKSTLSSEALKKIKELEQQIDNIRTGKIKI